MKSDISSSVDGVLEFLDCTCKMEIKIRIVVLSI